MKYWKLASATAAMALSANVNAAMIHDGSFEMGNLMYWEVSDLTNPFDPLTAAVAGSLNCT
jgi:hypothetical protein